jgi:hypothetical protein
VSFTGGRVPGLLRRRTALPRVWITRRGIRLSPALSAHHGDVSRAALRWRALGPLAGLRDIWPVGSAISRNVGIWDSGMARVCWAIVFVYWRHVAGEEAIDAPGIGLRGAGRRDFIGPAVPIAVFGRHVCCVVRTQGRRVFFRVVGGCRAEIRGAHRDAVRIPKRRFLDGGRGFAVVWVMVSASNRVDVLSCACSQVLKEDV